MADDVTVYYNARCSKCRTAKTLLDEQGVAATYYRYLDHAPTRDQIEAVIAKLGIDDPRAMMRTGESAYEDLGLADADADALIDAMATHPILIERPIVVVGDRAVIARPPERALDLF